MQTNHHLSKLAATLAASLIAADGVVEDNEKEIAISTGQRMLSGFTRAIFEEALADLDHAPSAYELARPLRHQLDEESRDQLMDYLAAVASADQEVVQVELAELQAVAQALGVPLPPIPTGSH